MTGLEVLPLTRKDWRVVDSQSLNLAGGYPLESDLGCAILPYQLLTNAP